MTNTCPVCKSRFSCISKQAAVATTATASVDKAPTSAPPASSPKSTDNQWKSARRKRPRSSPSTVRVQNRDQHVPVRYTSLALPPGWEDEDEEFDSAAEEDRLLDEEWEADPETQYRLQRELLELQAEAAAASGGTGTYLTALSGIMGRIVQHNSAVSQRRQSEARAVGSALSGYHAGGMSNADLMAIQAALEEDEGVQGGNTGPQPPPSRRRRGAQPANAAAARPRRRRGAVAAAPAPQSHFARAAERSAIAAVAAADDPSALYIGDSDEDEDLAQLRSLQQAVSEDGLGGGRRRQGGGRRRGSMSGPPRRVPATTAADDSGDEHDAIARGGRRRAGGGRRAARLARLAAEVDVAAVVQEYEGGEGGSYSAASSGDVSPSALRAHLQRRALMAALDPPGTASQAASGADQSLAGGVQSVDSVLRQLDELADQATSTAAARSASAGRRPARRASQAAAPGVDAPLRPVLDLAAVSDSDSDSDAPLSLAQRLAARRMVDRCVVVADAEPVTRNTALAAERRGGLVPQPQGVGNRGGATPDKGGSTASSVDSAPGAENQEVSIDPASPVAAVPRGSRRRAAPAAAPGNASTRRRSARLSSR